MTNPVDANSEYKSQILAIIIEGNFNKNTIYSGIKDTTAIWNGQVEKLASYVDIVRVEDQTVPMFIGFTDDPSVEPTDWFDIGLTSPKDLSPTGNYVAWYSVGTGTFKLGQSKKYI